MGIVGRSGAGKSSILQILFRLSELDEGSVTIDGVNIKDVGLHLLRKNIAYIPQSPFLIQGTVRENLDPFSQKTESEVWENLAKVNLSDHVMEMKDKLQSIVTENNNLFSMG